MDSPNLPKMADGFEKQIQLPHIQLVIDDLAMSAAANSENSSFILDTTFVPNPSVAHQISSPGDADCEILLEELPEKSDMTPSVLQSASIQQWCFDNSALQEGERKSESERERKMGVSTSGVGALPAKRLTDTLREKLN